VFCNLVVLPVFLCTYNLCFIDDDDYSGPLRAIMDGIAPNIYQFIAIYCQKKRSSPRKHWFYNRLWLSHFNAQADAT